MLRNHLDNSLNLLVFKHKHYPLLQDMLKDQECPWKEFISYKTLPKIGYIVTLQDQPIATGFLRKVEGGYGQLDTFATNPYFGSKLRHAAIEMIVDALMDDAKRLKLHGLLVFSHDSGIIKRSEERGFKPLPDTLLGFKA